MQYLRCHSMNYQQAFDPVLFAFLRRCLKKIVINKIHFEIRFNNITFTFFKIGVLVFNLCSDGRYPLECTVQVFTQLGQHLSVLLQILAGGFQVTNGKCIAVGQHFVCLFKTLQPKIKSGQTIGYVRVPKTLTSLFER